MTAFQYQAIKLSDKSRVNGLINADSERQAREMLREQELMPTQLQVLASKKNVIEQGKKLNPLTALLQRFSNVGIKDKIAFSRSMAMMIKAGIPVTEALLYYENYAPNAKVRDLISQVRRDILSGYTLSQALGKHKKVFNEVYTNITKAGEESGELEETFARMTELLVRSDKLKMKLISAATYPTIVVGIMALVMLIMFMFVLPTFAEIYQKMGIKLPLITVIMMGISTALRGYWFITFPAIGGAIWGIYKFFTSEPGQLLYESKVVKLPVVGEVVRLANASHFISTFSVAFGAGLPITDALTLAVEAVRHNGMRQAFERVNMQIQSGQKLAVALTETRYIPDIVLLMISTGEESGELDKMLENSFEYLDAEVNHRLDILTSLMEPIMLVVLGVMVALVALSIYLPMFEMYKHL